MASHELDKSAATNGPARDALLASESTATTAPTPTPTALSLGSSHARGGPADGSFSGTAQLIDRAISGDNHAEAQSASMMLFVAVSCACISPMLFGFTISFTSPTQDTMEGDAVDGVDVPSYLSALTASTEAWYASLLNIGAVLGAFSGSFLSDRFGRKRTLVLTAVPHIIGWVGTGLVSNAFLLILLRIIIGWGVGVGSAVTPVYIGEVATTGLRGALGAANQLSVTFGIFFVNLFGTFVFVVEEQDKQFVQWRLLSFLGGAMAVLLGIVSFLPESPKWLASQGKDEATSAALAKLRAGDCSMEAQELLSQARAQAASTTTDATGVSLTAYSRSLVVGVGLCVFQQLGGVNAVMMYTSKICEQSGMSASTANTAAVGVMGLQVLLTGVSCLLMERAGRRALLLFGSMSMSLAHLVLAYYFLAEDNDSLWGPSWLAMAALAVFITGFSVGLGPIPWLILAELFPTEVRSSASSLATAMNWSCSFIVVLIFPALQKAIQPAGTYLLFSVVCGLCFLFVLMLVPETKGKSVEEVLQLLQPSSARTISLPATRQQSEGA